MVHKNLTELKSAKIFVMKKFVVTWSSPGRFLGRPLVKNSALTVWELALNNNNIIVPTQVCCKSLSDDIKFEEKSYENAVICHPPVEVHSTKLLLFLSGERQQFCIVYHLDTNGQLSFDFEFLEKCSYYYVHAVPMKGLLLITDSRCIKGYDFLNKGALNFYVKFEEKNRDTRCFIITGIGSKYIICQYDEENIDQFFLVNIESEKVSDITSLCKNVQGIHGWVEDDSNFAFLQGDEIVVYSVDFSKIIWRRVQDTSQVGSSNIR